MVQALRAPEAARRLTAAQAEARQARDEDSVAEAREQAEGMTAAIGSVIYMEDGKKAPVLSKSGKSLTFGYGHLPDDLQEALALALKLPLGTTFALTITCNSARAVKGMPEDKAAAILNAAKKRRDLKNAKQAGDREDAPDNSGWVD